ncbi:hypothetical protein CSA80_04210 [Candidatus Saccharibacteria bacterium]|nr:MAG: hypothetical protein CR973_01715 [Candidatus Saccharibacteria bacterium]PID98877.1 MAG: hypothetical protein CSA80_04210 [Candidatus Saccharibacteria bacterium]
MSVRKNFIQDRSSLLLVSINAFLMLAAITFVALKLDASKGTSNYIISFRSSLGLNGYTQGTVWDVMGLIAAAVVFFVVGLVLAYRTYPIRRELSLVVLALTMPLLVLLIIVSNALLLLR